MQGLLRRPFECLCRRFKRQPIGYDVCLRSNPAPSQPLALQPLQPTLGQRLREATKALHREVERAGVMPRLLRGTLPQAGYCLLLRNLHAVYEALECAVQACDSAHAVQSLAPSALWRAGALQEDLLVLHGKAWRDELTLAPATQDYVLRLAELASEQSPLLAAHAYVRYLGDLNGGQMLARLVGPTLRAPAGQGLAFYRVEATDSVADLKARFKQALDRQASTEAQAQALVQEACSAFVRHRELFEQLDEMVSCQPERGPVSSRI